MSRLGFQPAVPSFRHEFIVVQLRVGTIYAVNLLLLSGTKSFTTIETPNAFKQPLPSKHFMEARDTARKMVWRIKERRIAIGYLNVFFEQGLLHRCVCARQFVAFLQECSGALRPNRPVAQ